MVRTSLSGFPVMRLAIAGGLLVALSGCVAAPLASLAYQAATTPTKPCATSGTAAGCESGGLSSAVHGLTQASQQALGGSTIR